MQAEQREERLQTLRRVLRLNAFAVPFVVAALALVAVDGAPVWLWVVFAGAVVAWARGVIGLMRSDRRERHAGQ